LEDIEELSSMRQVRELFAQMKNVYVSLMHRAKSVHGKVEQLPGEGFQEETKEFEKRKTMMFQDGVGDLDDNGEFGLGVAPRTAKPTNKIEMAKEKEDKIKQMLEDDLDEQKEGQEDEDESKMEIIRLKKQREKKRKPIDRQTAFLEFKATEEGKQLEDQIIGSRQDLKEKKEKVKDMTTRCNQCKKELDVYMKKLEAKAEEKREQMRDDLAQFDDEEGGDQQQQIIDEEDLAYMQKVRELKKVYRESFDMLKETKSEVFYVQQGINSQKQQLVAQFEDWFINTFEEDGNDSMTKTGYGFFESGGLAGEFENLNIKTAKEGEEQEGVHADPDALAFIRAKKKVDDLTRAKKNEKK